MTYQLPILTFTSLRGSPGPATDEPQHAVMGPSTPGMLDSVDVPHHTLYAQDGVEEFSAVLEKAEKDLAEQRAPFVLVERGAIGKALRPMPLTPKGFRPLRPYGSSPLPHRRRPSSPPPASPAATPSPWPTRPAPFTCKVPWDTPRPSASGWHWRVRSGPWWSWTGTVRC
ncbi:hypothetical protein SHIRM173S_08070 [Streptomyces hirsutus]